MIADDSENNDSENGSNRNQDELKSEFGQQYHTDPNEASRMFKGGGLLSDPKKRIGLLVLVFLIAGGVFYYYTMEPTTPEIAALNDEVAPEGGEKKLDATHPNSQHEDHKAKELGAAPEHASPGQDNVAVDPKAHEAKMGETAVSTEKPKIETIQPSEVASDIPKLKLPLNGSTITYDESSMDPVFEWSEPGDEIIFSHNANMTPVDLTFPLKGAHKFEFQTGYPGVWYWQVKNEKGVSEIRTFEILPPSKRVIEFESIKEGESLQGNGGELSWVGDHKINYYKVEFSNDDFKSLKYSFATAATALKVSDVAPGSYKLRLAAFSEVSARWEYSNVLNVTVQ